MIPDASSVAEYLPAVYLRTICADPAAANEAGCATTSQPGNAQLTLSSLAAGSYYVIVDGVSGSAGKFTLQVVVSP